MNLMRKISNSSRIRGFLASTIGALAGLIFGVVLVYFAFVFKASAQSNTWPDFRGGMMGVQKFLGDLAGLVLTDTVDNEIDCAKPVTGDTTFLSLGAATTTSHALGSNDVVFADMAEFNGDVYMDASLYMANVYANGVTRFKNTPLFEQGLYVGTGYAGMRFATEDTPDTFVLHTDSASNAAVFCEAADYSYDFAHPQQTNPTLFFHSTNQSTTEWTSITHNQTDAVVGVGKGNIVLGGNAIVAADNLKAIADGVATAFVRIAVAQGTHNGGSIIYGIHANDATDYQVRNGVVTWAAVNKAGTETCDTQLAAASEAVAVSAGTLTASFSCASASADTIDISVNANTSLTPTTLEIHYNIFMNDTSLVTPQ